MNFVWSGLIAAFGLVALSAQAQDLRVLTSFPPAVSDAYVALFERDDGAPRVQVLNKNTVAGIDEVLRGNDRNFDIFWSSSPEAFEILHRNGAFVDADGCGPDGPAPVAPFALSAVGWARRADSDVFMPADWNDLLRPLYRDRVAMARPARSGTTHMLVEQLLLVRGWEDGWAYLLELAGNLSTLTARSFGVPDGLENKRFEIGLTIDFLAQSRGETLRFRYGRPMVLVPAQIGVLRGGLQTEAACEFLQLTLSREGQMALLSPEISRVPFDPAIRAELAHRLPVDIVEALKLSWLDYDAEISANRYWAVNTLFDLMIAEALPQRRHLWRRYHALKGRVPDEQLGNIRRQLTTVVISEEEALRASGSVNGGLRKTALAGLGEAERGATQEWRQRISAQLRAADLALAELERQEPG
ncbi:MAG: ABC transporter substrate-binding protein [Paracoccaceae bacterium]